MLYNKRTVAIVLNATDCVLVCGNLGMCDPEPVSNGNQNHRGYCPECHEPKFEVNPIKQIGKCFNEDCAFGGGIIKMVAASKKCTDDEALEYLAREAKIKIPERPKERRRLFGFFKDSVPYYFGLREIAKSVTGAIVMGQLEYWFERYPDGFYKFLEPAKKNTLYKPGQSWKEELNISAEEFKTAFDKIGIRYATKSNFEDTPPDDRFFKSPEEDYLYCSYCDKREGTTTYLRNPKVDRIIDKLLAGESVKKEDDTKPAKTIKTKLGATLYKDAKGRFVKEKTVKRQHRFTTESDAKSCE